MSRSLESLLLWVGIAIIGQVPLFLNLTDPWLCWMVGFATAFLACHVFDYHMEKTRGRK